MVTVPRRLPAGFGGAWRHERCAFTILEFLVASALAALLMVALLLVMGSLARDRRGIDSPGVEDPAQRRLVQVVRDDLLAASSIRCGALVLSGHGGLDPATLRPAQRPALVEYRIVDSGGRKWLLRRQQNLEIGMDQSPWSELVCGGVKSLSLAAVDVEPESPRGGPSAAVGAAMPARVRLMVQWESRAPLERMIILRAPAR